MYAEVFSNRLKMARKGSGLSQATVASEIGIKYTTLSNYETGAREPDLETLAKLAVFYGESADWFLGLTPISNNANTKATIEMTNRLEQDARKEAKEEKKVGFFGEIKGGRQYINEGVTFNG